MMLYKLLDESASSPLPSQGVDAIYGHVIEQSKGKEVGERYTFDEVVELIKSWQSLTAAGEGQDELWGEVMSLFLALYTDKPKRPVPEIISAMKSKFIISKK